MGLDNIFYSENFECPTDEIVVKSPPSPFEGKVVKLKSTTCRVMSARLANQTFNSSSSSNSLDQLNDSLQCSPDDGSEDHDNTGREVVIKSDVEHVHTRDVIVIPANADAVQLQQAIQQVSANGVTVLDVRGLGEGSGQSSPGSEQVAVVQTGEGQHYIAVSGDGPAVGYHVQYVESQELYTQQQPGQTQMTYPVYTVGEGGTLYGSSNTSTVGTCTDQNGSGNAQWNSYSTSPNSSTHHYLLSATAVEDSPTVSVSTLQRSSPPQTLSADVSYLSSGGGSDDSAAAQTAAHAARTSPATVQWLLENYENAEGVSLPRSTLYNHYLRHCAQRELEPVNAASFGKLIRSVFLGLRTRRLGTRGNSKYHYYGIRVKPDSPLSMTYNQCENSSGTGGTSSSNKLQNSSRYSKNAGNNSQQRPDSAESMSNSHMNQHHQYLGDGAGAIPDFPEITFTGPLPGDCSLEDVDTLKAIYREHCEAFLDAVLNLELSTVESLWREFWRQNNNNESDECEEEKYLSKTKLYQLCNLSEVQTWVRAVDVAFYQKLVQVLLPDVLRPIPSLLTQAIRNFAKGLESWLVGAMGGCPIGMIRAKAAPAAALAQSLRRYTSLNHLAQAARAVLHNSQQISQMLTDLNRVDFHNVQEQASWVCQCPNNVVAALEADFKKTLQRQASLEQWAAWLEAAVCKALQPYEQSTNYAHHARQFLLKWSFYSSMVIRDLTLRSAASFGSFHLIRLLYDEYMFYLIEHRVAAHQGSAPIQVMSENDLTDNGSLKFTDLEDYEEITSSIKSELPTPKKAKTS